MIATSAPEAEPAVKPTMSGLPRALEDTTWKRRPESPKAAPTPMPAMVLGRRTDWTK